VLPKAGVKILLVTISKPIMMAPEVNVIDSESLELIKQITVGDGPHGLRVDPQGNNLYVGVTKSNEIVVIDSQSLEIVNKIDSGNIPFWIAIPGNS
jgi:YVTN family beta-propeller protein